MTLIEFFDPNVNANIVSCLHLRPKKVVFLGDDPEMNATIERYKVFFAKKTTCFLILCRFTAVCAPKIKN